MNEREPQTLIEAVRYFADGSACAEYMRDIKWPDGKVTCPKCGGDNIGRIKTRSLHKCRACNKQFSDKVDTIFEDSLLPLSSWFVGVWQINCKNGVSSLELSHALGITQKTAWFMLHRIRLAMCVMDAKKPTGGKAFDDLARKLVRVPKRIVLAAEQRYEKRKQERKRKKS